MDQTFVKVALRFHGLYLGIRREDIGSDYQPTPAVMAFVRRLNENGFCVSEELLHALTLVSANTLGDITSTINEVMGTDLNWAPLVRGWNVPTGETLADHLVTWFVNACGLEDECDGRRLPCGHFIPDGTFPIERYNGCPFCGTPFVTDGTPHKGQGSKLKEMRLFTDDDIRRLFVSLLTSPTPLDATQLESVEQLAAVLDIPQDTQIPMKETCMVTVKALIGRGRGEEAAQWLKTPTDVLRFLWYDKTGRVQLIEPRTLIAHAGRLNRAMWLPEDLSEDAQETMRRNLMLRYDRRWCRLAARWLNSVPMDARAAAEDMNPKRGVWVRMIRALRLGEYSRKKGYGHLAEILDIFYRHDYATWQGRVDAARKENDADNVLTLLKERPGMFARCLFATMLRFGADRTLNAFMEVADRLPSRLLLSLANAAESYFDPTAQRIARPITGGAVMIEPNNMLALYTEEERKAMTGMTDTLFRNVMAQRFAREETTARTMYIDPRLYDIPLSVGDRSRTLQDTSCALQGTRFRVEGDSVRLFLQWGKGLPAQHLDMDLSCRIMMSDGQVEECSYYNLQATGAKHSGDIRSIPDEVGTAEYIELDLPELEKAGASYVMFACNAYSCGSLSPNLIVGWMSSENPMELSEENGVAYDPSCVQHLVRVGDDSLDKGLVFGVLKVESREIVWLEMPFMGQTIASADSAATEAMLKRLEEKTSIGELLEIKAKAQGMSIVGTDEEADERYTYEWALNPADVSNMLL